MLSQWERTGRFSNEHARMEGLVNDALGSLGQAVRAAVQATHFLTCGVPDRESNEIKYLREATEVIENWQRQLQDGQPDEGHILLHAILCEVDSVLAEHLTKILTEPKSKRNVLPCDAERWRPRLSCTLRDAKTDSVTDTGNGVSHPVRI